MLKWANCCVSMESMAWKGFTMLLKITPLVIFFAEDIYYQISKRLWIKNNLLSKTCDFFMSYHKSSVENTGQFTCDDKFDI